MTTGGPPPAAMAGEIGAVLTALADPTRRDLLEVLVGAGQASATSLARQLPVSRQAVVKHLRVLESAGLVEGVRVGREVRYSPRPAHLAASARWLAELSARWDRRLSAIKGAAEAPPGGARPRAGRGRAPVENRRDAGDGTVRRWSGSPGRSG